MGTITGGHVLYSRKTKPGDYEHEQADVMLSFNVEDGGDAAVMAAHVGEIAKRQARTLLGFKDAQPAPAPVVQTAASGDGDKAKLAAAVVQAPATEAPKARAKKPPAVPAAAPKAAEPAPQPEPAKANGADSIDDLLGTAPTEITDVELVAKVTQTNGRIKNAAAIKALTIKYVPFPKGVKDIPQELRTKYCAELDALQPSA